MKIYRDKWFWLSIGLFLTLGLLSGIFALNARTYYQTLTLPPFAPPGSIFGPVWSVLYILIGIAHYYLWKWNESRSQLGTLILFYVQFGLNILWSMFFFTMKNTGVAMIDITVLWLILFVLQIVFLLRDKKILWLMMPYFLWVSFATILNLGIYILN